MWEVYLPGNQEADEEALAAQALRSVWEVVWTVRWKQAKGSQ